MCVVVVFFVVVWCCGVVVLCWLLLVVVVCCVGCCVGCPVVFFSFDRRHFLSGRVACCFSPLIVDISCADVLPVVFLL